MGEKLAEGFWLGREREIPVFEPKMRIDSFSTTVSFSLGHGLFRNTAAYWEVYKIGPISKDGDDLWMFNAGLTHALGDNAQLDFSVGRSLSPTTPNWFVGVGFTIRSPLR